MKTKSSLNWWLCLMLLAVPAFPAQNYVLTTGRSGVTFKILGISKMRFTEGEPALTLSYQTDLDLSDREGLRLEAREIWSDFQVDAEKSGLDDAVISVNTAPHGVVPQKGSMYNFYFQKNAEGRWTCDDKRVNQWLRLVDEKDAQKQIAGLKEWAVRGDRIAQVGLGNLYQYGIGGAPKDPAEAMKWYQMAGRKGDAVAENNIGMIYMTGQGVTQDYAEAVKWFTRSAGAGNALAEDHLGAMYLKGMGVTQDNQQAVQWLTKSSDQGLAAGVGDLGSLYLGVPGIPKDLNRAFALTHKASEMGSPEAQASLCYMYALGYGVGKDCDEAFKWAQLSAKGGSPAGEDNLGSCYETGCGTAKDPRNALKYYRLSAEHGSPEGKNDLDRLQAGASKGP